MSMRCLLPPLLCTAMSVAAAPRAGIELLPQVRVTAGTVVLGEVARLHANDLDLMRRLVHLPVGQAPRADAGAVLQRDALAQWIRRQGIPSDLLQWSGAQEVRVLRAAAQLAGEEVARAAVDALRAQLADRGHLADVQARLVPRDIDMPPGPRRLDVRGLERTQWRPRSVVWVDIWAGERFVRTVPVALAVEFSQVAPVAPPSTADTPVRREAGLPAAAEEREPLAVARGDWANLRSADGPITLERRVEVLQDGHPGQKVRVRNPGSPGQFSARVLGRGQLELAP